MRDEGVPSPDHPPSHALEPGRPRPARSGAPQLYVYFPRQRGNLYPISKTLYAEKLHSCKLARLYRC